MVQSHGVRGGIANLAPMTLGSSSMVGGWGTSGLHGRLHAFVKRALLEQLVSPGAAVCDLFCGRGMDTSNWAQVAIGKYIGIDLSASALEEAREQWEKHGQSLPATFQELDPCTGNLEILQDAGLPVDVVSCFAHLQDYFASEGMVRLLMKNVVSLLKPGGYFFGFTPDSSTIWYKYQKAVEEAMKVGSLRVNGTLPRVRSPLYTITFEDDRFQFFGSKYQLRFVDGLPAQIQQLVHFPSFIRLAEEAGLEYVEIQNLTEFYDDYRVPFASTLQSSCKNLVDQKGQPMVDSRGKLSAAATDVLSLYSTFIFKKSTRIMPPTISSEFHLDTDLEESSLKSDSSTKISNRSELQLDNTPEVLTSREKHREISLSNGEEYPQDDLLDTARPEGGSSDADVNDSTSPSNRAESNPQEIMDTPNHGQLYSLTQGNLPSDVNYQQHFQGIDRFVENRSSNSVDRDRSVSLTPTEDFEYAQEQFLDAHELYAETATLSSEERDDHFEDEIAQNEKIPTGLEEIADPMGTAPRNERVDRRRLPTRLRRSVFTTNDSEMTGQTCSVNYQSEVEQEPISPQLQNSIPAPPPFRFYQRKRRSETGLEVAREANFSTNTVSIRALRPRRSSSVGDSKLVLESATKAITNSKAKRGAEIVGEKIPCGSSSEGSLSGNRKRGAGKATSSSQNCQPQISHDAGNGRRYTRSCSTVPSATGDTDKPPQRATSELRTMTTRMTRMRTMRSSL